MSIDFNNLEVGSIYQLDLANAKPIGDYQAPFKKIEYFKKWNINFIKIKQRIDHGGGVASYMIIPLGDDFKENPVVWHQIINPRWNEPLVNQLSDRDYIPILRKVSNIEIQRSNLASLGDKSKVQALKDVFSKKGLPDTSSAGPLQSVLKMAGIATPPKQSGVGRKTRKYKKSKRNTRKRK